MEDFNRVSVLGNITRDPELREGEDWKVANFGVAVGGRGEDEVHFFDVSAWGASADYAMRNVQKGRRVLIDGRLQQNRWTDDQGQNRSRVEIVARDVFFLGPRREGGGDTESA